MAPVHPQAGAQCAVRCPGQKPSLHEERQGWGCVFIYFSYRASFFTGLQAKFKKPPKNLASQACPCSRALLKQLSCLQRSCNMRNEESAARALPPGYSIFPTRPSQNPAGAAGCGHGNCGSPRRGSPGFVQLCPSILAGDLPADL